MKIYSWNVNGIRAIVKKGFIDFLKKEQPDILCLQEVKISDDKKEQANFDFVGYEEFWHSAKRPGYSGTLMLIKEGLKILGKSNGLGLEKFDSEGRVQILELPKFYLLNVYFPNSNDQLSRLPYKLEFNEALLKKIKNLEKKKPVILTGDYNVAHQEIDLTRPKANEGSAGFTEAERAWMTKFLKQGFVDSFRYLHPETIKYSWWSFRAGARARNVGWRIDYFCLSKKLAKNIKKADILDKIQGSDHAPVVLEL